MSFWDNPLKGIGNFVSDPLHSGLVTAARDAVEVGAADFGNTFIPGSSLLTDKLISKNAQKFQNSTIGKLGQVGSSIYGAFNSPLFAKGVPATAGSSIAGVSTAGTMGASTAESEAMAAKLAAMGSSAGSAASEMGASTAATTGAATGASSMGSSAGSAASEMAASAAPITEASSVPGLNNALGNANPSVLSATADLASAATAGMSTAQKIALGMSAVNTVGQLVGVGQKTVNTDPYGTGAAAGATSTSLLQKFNSGQIMPSDQAGIAQYQDQATAAIRDYYQKAGLGDSSMAQQAIAQVGVQANQMRQAALNNMYSQAMSAADVSGQYATAAVQQAVSQNQLLMTAQSSFTNLMMQYAMDSGGQKETKGTGATA
jgi:hypothetical protein